MTMQAIESGNVGEATSTTLTDSAKSWLTDLWDGYVVAIVGGTGTGQWRAITSNTATVLTCGSFATTPDSTSRYAIYSRGGRRGRS